MEISSGSTIIRKKPEGKKTLKAEILYDNETQKMDYVDYLYLAVAKISGENVLTA